MGRSSVQPVVQQLPKALGLQVNRARADRTRYRGPRHVHGLTRGAEVADVGGRRGIRVRRERSHLTFVDAFAAVPTRAVAGGLLLVSWESWIAPLPGREGREREHPHADQGNGDEGTGRPVGRLPWSRQLSHSPMEINVSSPSRERVLLPADLSSCGVPTETRVPAGPARQEARPARGDG